MQWNSACRVGAVASALGVDWVFDLDHTGLDANGDEDAKQNQSNEQLLHCTPRVTSRLAICGGDPLTLRCGNGKRSEHTGGQPE